MRKKILGRILDIQKHTGQHFIGSDKLATTFGLEKNTMASYLAVMVEEGWLIGNAIGGGWIVDLTPKAVVFLADPTFLTAPTEGSITISGDVIDSNVITGDSNTLE